MTLKNNELDIIIDALEQEDKFYKDRKNPDWSIDKNSGFKLGIKYCKELLESIKGQNNEYDEQQFCLKMYYIGDTLY